MAVHAPILTHKSWHGRALVWEDAAATFLVLSLLLLIGIGARGMSEPFAAAHQSQISLSPLALPAYTLHTVMRMLAALIASLLFTFIYATAAAKSRRAEMILIPILDVLQSVPVLGYLSFTVAFFVGLSPDNQLGPELAAIFAIFTSQAWNMAFSFFQSLRTIPTDLNEVSRSFRVSAWQRFWRLEVPFAMPGLIWNTMMSMSGGWFFVVASEAISVGTLHIALPGIGSYVALAIEERNLGAVGWAIGAMAAAIILYDQILFRPLVAWAEKFRFEQTAAQVVPRSWMLDLLNRSTLLRLLGGPIARGLHRLSHSRFAMPEWVSTHAPVVPKRAFDVLCSALLIAAITYIAWELFQSAMHFLSWRDLKTTLGQGGVTLLRVAILIALASLVWVPIGVYVGLRPRFTEWIQPAAQFLAAFPANVLFPLSVYFIVHFNLAPNVWLSPLMVLGTQWYILFNVIAGAAAFPTDLREAAASLRVHQFRWWRQVMLPGIFPYYVTGAIAASGGAWNASIVAESVNWGSTKLSASGLGAYIAQMTEAGDYPRIGLGVVVIAMMVIAMNRLLWRPLYAFAERRMRLD